MVMVVSVCQGEDEFKDLTKAAQKMVKSLKKEFAKAKKQAYPVELLTAGATHFVGQLASDPMAAKDTLEGSATRSISYLLAPLPNWKAPEKDTFADLFGAAKGQVETSYEKMQKWGQKSGVKTLKKFGKMKYGGNRLFSKKADHKGRMKSLVTIVAYVLLVELGLVWVAFLVTCVRAVIQIVMLPFDVLMAPVRLLNYVKDKFFSGSKKDSAEKEDVAKAKRT